MRSVHYNFYDRSRTLSQIKESLEPKIKTVSLKQIHSSKIVVVDDPTKFNGIEADGAITNLLNTALTVHTADCLPLLAHGKEYIGACHGGWRGVSQNILENWIQEFKNYGEQPRDIKIFVGPAIGPCHFEVGQDVAELLTKSGGQKHPHPNKDKAYIDLWELAKLRLLNAGISEKNLEIIRNCTYCDEGKYHSYRRDGAHNGRLEGVIYFET